jgi:hypothetical protein
VRVILSLLFASAALAVGSDASRITEFPFRYEGDLLWVKVRAAGSDQPLDFLVDSGAQVSVINLGTARQLGLPLGSKVMVRGVRTARTGYWPQAVAAGAGGVPLPDQYLALDLSAFSRACGKPVDGLIGADFFRKRIVQIDYEARKVRLLGSSSTLSRADAVPLEFRECGMRIKVGVNDGEPQFMRLDTGCASALQWVTRRVRAEECSDLLAVGLAEVTIPQTRTTVALADRVIHDVPTGLHSKPIFAGEAGLVGNGLLARFRCVTVDARSGLLFLGASSSGSRPFSLLPEAEPVR